MDTPFLAPPAVFIRKLLNACLKTGDSVLDGTAGNGHDTLFLAQCVGASGRVFAFDVQQSALDNTAARLQAAGCAGQVSLIRAGHERLADYVDTSLAAAVFNFGYLPGGDKQLTTQADTSIAALAAACKLLRPGGLLTATLYPGHEAGEKEANAVETWASTLSQQDVQVLRYQFINQRNRPPYLLVFEKCRPAPATGNPL